jgi:hypothetical protein
MIEAVRKHGHHIGRYFVVRRNQAGDALFVCPLSNIPPNSNAVIVLSGASYKLLHSPGRIAYLDDQHQFVAWSDDLEQNGVTFKNGYHFKLPPFALFNVDPSGNYFVVGEKPASTWVGSVAAPQARICISTNVLATRVFARDQRILVCGYVFRNEKSGTAQIPVCLILRQNGTGLIKEKELFFRWASGILDADLESEQLLLQNRSEFFPRCYLYDLKTQTRKNIGRHTGWCFFLKGDLLN